MIEVVLSILVIVLFVSTLSWILIGPVKKKNSILYNASVTDNAENIDDVMSRAINGKIVSVNYLNNQ